MDDMSHDDFIPDCTPVRKYRPLKGIEASLRWGSSLLLVTVMGSCKAPVKGRNLEAPQLRLGMTDHASFLGQGVLPQQNWPRGCRQQMN